MRDRGANVYLLVFLAFFGCTTMKYKDMASSDPIKLISLRDSLDTELSPLLVEAFLEAYNKVGIQAYKSENYNRATSLFLKSQELSPGDTLSKFYILMCSGKKKYEGGKKELLWESIQDFYKASALYPKRGAPFYFIGQSYSKLGDKDFDLIIESYEKAMLLEVDEELQIAISNAKLEAIRRKDLLKSFWK
jgi:lipoprotein NlpI